MKNSLLLLCSLFTGGVAVPAFAETAPASEQAPSLPTAPIPPEVAAMTPTGAQTLFIKRFSMGGTPVLVHLWRPVRSGTPDPLASRLKELPFFVDLYAPGSAPDSWLLANSSFFGQAAGPGEYPGLALQNVTVRWLQPAKKQGMVVVVSTGHGNAVEFLHLFPFPGGVAIRPGVPGIAGGVVSFHQGEEADSGRTQKFGIDKNGYMTIVDTSTSWGVYAHDGGEKRVTTTVYKWSGWEFSAGG